MNMRSGLYLTKVRPLTGAFLTLAVVLIGTGAAAEPIEFEASAGFSSMLIDRGESLATLNNELDLSITKPTNWGSLYAGVYRITPLGEDRRAFDEEVDYTIGFSTGSETVNLDVSANYLTYPGSSEQESLELAAELGWAHAWAPGLAAFYDVDFDVYGAEVFAGPSTNLGTWSMSLIGRAGFVASDEGDYSYAGLEGTAARDLSDAVSLEAFVRVEAADEDTFADRVDGSDVTRIGAEGVGIGVRFTARR